MRLQQLWVDVSRRMSKAKHCTNSVMFCPPLTNAVFPATLGYLSTRTDQHQEVPIKVRMAWGGAGDRTPDDRAGGRSTRGGGGVERPRPAPSPETPARHRPAKMARRPTRCVRSTNSTFYNARTKLIFLKDVSSVHCRPDSDKTRSITRSLSPRDTILAPVLALSCSWHRA